MDSTMKADFKEKREGKEAQNLNTPCIAICGKRVNNAVNEASMCSATPSWCAVLSS